uniref:Uncharacterized protein n=1 Tax=Babesia bovis TaxID=5865 RepID=S6C898_BABBO|nr:hypothetical protein [Babesia bovis]
MCALTYIGNSIGPFRTPYNFFIVLNGDGVIHCITCPFSTPVPALGAVINFSIARTSARVFLLGYFPSRCVCDLFGADCKVAILEVE